MKGLQSKLMSSCYADATVNITKSWKIAYKGIQSIKPRLAGLKSLPNSSPEVLTHASSVFLLFKIFTYSFKFLSILAIFYETE